MSTSAVQVEVGSALGDRFRGLSKRGTVRQHVPAKSVLTTKINVYTLHFNIFIVSGITRGPPRLRPEGMNFDERPHSARDHKK